MDAAWFDLVSGPFGLWAISFCQLSPDMVGQHHHQFKDVVEPDTDPNRFPMVANGSGLFEGGDFCIDIFEDFLGGPALIGLQLGDIHGTGGADARPFQGVEIEALRQLCYHCVRMLVAQEDVTKEVSMAKLKGGRLAREIADTCLQFHGGMGYVEEYPMARYFRDARLMSIGGGADEIMLGIIAKYEDILPRRKK